MHEALSVLNDLQELEIVCSESLIVHRRGRPEQLAEVEEKIQQLRQWVPEVLLRRYDNLRRNGLGVVPVIAGLCRGCHLNIPIGDLNRMRNDQIPCVCPNCGRFLLLSDS